MAHFAELDENNVVRQVIVVDNSVAPDEATGQAYLAFSGFEGTWKQTSYNTRAGIHYGPDGTPDGQTQYRGNYAGVGMIYDATHDAFIGSQPSPTAVLNTTTFTWEEPVVASAEPATPTA